MDPYVTVASRPITLPTVVFLAVHAMKLPLVALVLFLTVGPSRGTTLSLSRHKIDFCSLIHIKSSLTL